MASPRLWRLAAAGLTLAALLHFGGEITTQIVAAPRPQLPRPALFDSIDINPVAISPNNDAVQESLRVSYRVTDSTRVRIYVTPEGSLNVTASLLDRVQDRGRYITFWNGKRSSDHVVVPEGPYTIHFEEWAGSTLLLENHRRVSVDLKAPRAQIQSITPSPAFTPTLLNNTKLIRVRVAVGDSTDSLKVSLMAVRGTTTQTVPLRLIGAFQGDGEYEAVCDTCWKPTVRDGFYEVRVRASDRAGNSAIASGSILKDTQPPHIVLTRPDSTQLLFVQHADTLRGFAADPDSVRSLSVTVRGVTDSIRVVQPPPAVRDTVRFFVDVHDLDTEGRYRVILRAADRFGVASEVTRFLTVDRTPPSRPVFSPRPDPVVFMSPIAVRALVDTLQATSVTGGAADSVTVLARSPVVFQVNLQPGRNKVHITARDAAGNVSPPETTTVVWNNLVQLAVPERFQPGNAIQVQVGPRTSQVEVRIFAMDGNLVRQFRSQSSSLQHVFIWDLTTPDGRRVKNGAYLVRAHVFGGSAGDTHLQKLTAVLQ